MHLPEDTDIVAALNERENEFADEDEMMPDFEKTVNRIFIMVLASNF